MAERINVSHVSHDTNTHRHIFRWLENELVSCGASSKVPHCESWHWSTTVSHWNSRSEHLDKRTAHWWCFSSSPSLPLFNYSAHLLLSRWFIYVFTWLEFIKSASQLVTSSCDGLPTIIKSLRQLCWQQRSSLVQTVGVDLNTKPIQTQHGWLSELYCLPPWRVRIRSSTIPEGKILPPGTIKSCAGADKPSNP